MLELTLIVLYCSDIDASVAFYTGLGLHFTAERHGDGPAHFAAVLDGGGVLELYPAGDGAVTRTRLGLRAAGGEAGTVTDPDGNTVEIASARGWDGVSDFYEDDEPLKDILAATADPPDAITGGEYDPDVVRARALRRAAVTVRVVEWAAPQGISCPTTSAHASGDGAMARIASVAAEHGVEPVEGESSPGGMRMWFVGELVAMLRELELQQP